MSGLAQAKAYVSSLEALAAQARAYAALIELGQGAAGPGGAADAVRAILDVLAREICDLADEMAAAE